MTKRKTKLPVKVVRHEPMTGWGMTVGGSPPYVSSVFFCDLGCPGARAAAEQEAAFETYHKAVPVVLVTRADWRRILKQLKRGPQ